MERLELHNVAAMLDGLETGAWLRQELDLLGPARGAARVLVLQSAGRDFQRIYPGGLLLDSSWVLWEGSTDPGRHTIGQYDLIVWAMSAIQMFPGEFAAVLQQSRREEIPIWVVVAGLWNLSQKERETFLREDVANYTAGLPRNSVVLVHNGPNAVDPLEKMRQLYEARGAALAAWGEKRRVAQLGRQARRRLLDEEQIYLGSLSQADHFTTTAQQGINALKVLLAPVVAEILDAYRGLRRDLSGLRQMLRELLEVTDDSPAMPLGTSVEGALRGWRGSTWEPRLRQIEEQCRARVEHWRGESSEELASYLGSFKALRIDPQVIVQATSVEAGDFEGNLGDALDRLRDRLLAAYDMFLQRVQAQLRRAAAESTAVTRGEYARQGEGQRPGSEIKQTDAPPMSNWERSGRDLLNAVRELAGAEEEYQRNVKREVGGILVTELGRLGDQLESVVLAERESVATSLNQALDKSSTRGLGLIAPVAAAHRARLEQISAAQRVLTRGQS